MIKRSLSDEVELELERIAQGGAGVGRWQGQVVFAMGGLPGERVRVRLYQRRASYAYGQVVAILTPAPERVSPRLPAASHMPWQHIAYDAQVRFKQAIVQEQLAHLAGLTDVEVRPIVPAAHPWHYRNTAHLHVQNQQIGYYAAGSRRVVDLDADPLLLPVLNTALAGLRTLVPSTTATVHDVVLRASATYGYAIAALKGIGALPALAAKWHARVPQLAGVAWNTARTDPNEPQALRLYEELGGIVFALGLHSFFQTHTAQAEALLTVVRDGLRLEPGQRVLDAYSGVGTFALPLTHGSCDVVAIEENPWAVADGQYSAQLNAIDQVRFITAPVERTLATLASPFTAAILDPPRRGCHPAALAALINLAPPRIAYVSCHPGILARDLRILLQAGYHLAYVQPIDLFPQTPHIESVAFLELKRAPGWEQ